MTPLEAGIVGYIAGVLSVFLALVAYTSTRD